jgi:hypothetical protein
MTNTLTLFLLSVLFPSSVAVLDSTPGIEYGEVAHKVVDDHPDQDGELKISIKLSVRNDSDEDVSVDVMIRALDAEGFEVFEANLEGTVRAGATRVLTDSNYISPRIYKMISRWEIEDE